MYYDFFGLNQPPFKITPDTNMFFPGGKRGAVLQSLSYAITSGEGILKVVGEVGSGKTMLCRMLEIGLPESVEIVYLSIPSLTPESLLRAIAFELKLGTRPNDDPFKTTQLLQNYLLKRHAENRRVVMFVEEAQSMPLETLEEMRLLSNLETNMDKLLQIVLFGQPELDENLAFRNMRQLRERITYSFNLLPLKEYEVRDYLNTRLRVAGYQSMDLFTPGAVRRIWKVSDGLLRRINIVSDKACLAAYADNADSIKKAHVMRAVQDSEFSKTSRWRWWALVASGGALLVALVMLSPLGQTVWHDVQSRIAKLELSQRFSAITRRLADSGVASPETEETASKTSPAKRQEQTIQTPRYPAQHDTVSPQPPEGKQGFAAATHHDVHGAAGKVQPDLLQADILDDPEDIPELHRQLLTVSAIRIETKRLTRVESLGSRPAKKQSK